jgi:hypothetical protein
MRATPFARSQSSCSQVFGSQVSGWQVFGSCVSVGVADSLDSTARTDLATVAATRANLVSSYFGPTGAVAADVPGAAKK